MPILTGHAHNVADKQHDVRRGVLLLLFLFAN